MPMAFNILRNIDAYGIYAVGNLRHNIASRFENDQQDSRTNHQHSINILLLLNDNTSLVVRRLTSTGTI